MPTVTAQQTPVSTAPSDCLGSSPYPGTGGRRRRRAGAGTSTRTCAVCGASFGAVRPTARCCSGRCRIMLSRARRVADLVQRLAAAEAGLRAAELAIKDAALAVQDLRALAEQGGSKVAP